VSGALKKRVVCREEPSQNLSRVGKPRGQRVHGGDRRVAPEFCHFSRIEGPKINALNKGDNGKNSLNWWGIHYSQQSLHGGKEKMHLKEPQHLCPKATTKTCRAGKGKQGIVWWGKRVSQVHPSKLDGTLADGIG